MYIALGILPDGTKEILGIWIEQTEGAKFWLRVMNELKNRGVAEGKLRLFVAIDRTSKFAFIELHREAGKMIAAQFLRNLIAAVPYAIHAVLTDNVLCREAAADSASRSLCADNDRRGMQFEPDGFHRQRDRSLP